jgi:sugar/nucleoside kinase (ribokinase family)
MASLKSGNSNASIVCFGYVSPGLVFAVEKYPEANSGAYVSAKHPFIGADCAMAARTLARWGVQAHLIANALGDDIVGQRAMEQLTGEGVRAHFDLRRDVRTPEEVDVIDRAGTRTFFVDSTTVWNTLSEADLSPIKTASLLYVDWYVGQPARDAVACARAHDVPVYLNVEYSLSKPDKYFDLISQATYVQSAINDSTNTDEFAEDPHKLAEALRDAGAQIAFVTRGKFGALAMQGQTVVDVPAMNIEVTDAQGAGATFSAAAMYGLLQGWPLERLTQFATKAATLKCQKFGLLTVRPEEISTV